VLLYVNVTLGLSPWRYQRTKCWRKYFDLCKRERGHNRRTEKITKRRGFLICAVHQILLRWSNQGFIDKTYSMH